MHELRYVIEGLLFKLLRSLYGLKPLGKLWNQNIIIFYMSIGFRQLNSNSRILIRQSTSGKISIVSVCVDEFLLALNTMRNLDDLKAALLNVYDIKDLGGAKQIIWWQLTRNSVA